jgi:hypothetical protein
MKVDYLAHKAVTNPHSVPDESLTNESGEIAGINLL